MSKTTSKDKTIFDDIREWAIKRTLYKNGDIKTQYCKLGEEFGELGRAIIKEDIDEIVDSIGDMVIVLTNLTELAFTKSKNTFNIESCIESAFNQIVDRKGLMKNGSFIKDK